jgi:hypothetical protein
LAVWTCRGRVVSGGTTSVVVGAGPMSFITPHSSRASRGMLAWESRGPGGSTRDPSPG